MNTYKKSFELFSRCTLIILLFISCTDEDKMNSNPGDTELELDNDLATHFL